MTTPEQIREALWYASHCCFCGFSYPGPHPFPFLAENKPHKRACYVCLWCGPAILDEIPVPIDWLPPPEIIH